MGDKLFGPSRREFLQGGVAATVAASGKFSILPVAEITVETPIAAILPPAYEEVCWVAYDVSAYLEGLPATLLQEPNGYNGENLISATTSADNLEQAFRVAERNMVMEIPQTSAKPLLLEQAVPEIPVNLGCATSAPDKPEQK